MNKTANFKVINTHWVYSHHYGLVRGVHEQINTN
jgi:hypothetical protein